MKNKNEKKNKKRRKKNRQKSKAIIRFAIGQLVVLLVCIMLISSSRPVNIDDCVEKTIIVEDTEYQYYPLHNERVFSVYSKGIRYQFTNAGITMKYSSNELNQAIQPGEEIHITYVEHYGFWRIKNLVVDARSETDIYFDGDIYHTQQQSAFIGAIILSTILEAIYLFVFRPRY